MVEGRAERRIHRLQPERKGQVGLLGLRGAADRICVDADHLGRARRCRHRGLPLGVVCRQVRSGGRPHRWHRRVSGADRHLDGVGGPGSGERSWRRPLAPDVSQNARRAPPGPALQATTADRRTTEEPVFAHRCRVTDRERCAKTTNDSQLHLPTGVLTPDQSGSETRASHSARTDSLTARIRVEASIADHP